MTERQTRAVVCAVAIVPLTVSNALLVVCGRPGAAWILELVAAVAGFCWVLRARAAGFIRDRGVN